MKQWSRYVLRINRNCSGTGDKANDLSYCRDNHFGGAITYLLPFSLIALVPGIYLSYANQMYILLMVDLLTTACIVLVAFKTGISVRIRKTIFIGCIYGLSCILLYYLGLFGPGLVYLLATSIFSILIFKAKYKFWPAWITTFICVLLPLAMWYGIFPWPRHGNHSIGEWEGVSSNLVFLSFLSAALIPRLFNGLQEILDKEKQLRQQINMQQQSLQDALHKLHQKNKELERCLRSFTRPERAASHGDEFYGIAEKEISQLVG